MILRKAEPEKHTFLLATSYTHSVGCNTLFSFAGGLRCRLGHSGGVVGMLLIEHACASLPSVSCCVMVLPANSCQQLL